LFTDTETTCVDNCIQKVFDTEKVLRRYLPFKMTKANERANLTVKEMEKRLNNPTDAYGPYFEKTQE